MRFIPESWSEDQLARYSTALRATLILIGIGAALLVRLDQVISNRIIALQQGQIDGLKNQAPPAQERLSDGRIRIGPNLIGEPTVLQAAIGDYNETLARGDVEATFQSSKRMVAALEDAAHNDQLVLSEGSAVGTLAPETQSWVYRSSFTAASGVQNFVVALDSAQKAMQYDHGPRNRLCLFLAYRNLHLDGAAKKVLDEATAQPGPDKDEFLHLFQEFATASKRAGLK